MIENRSSRSIRRKECQARYGELGSYSIAPDHEHICYNGSDRMIGMMKAMDEISEAWFHVRHGVHRVPEHRSAGPLRRKEIWDACEGEVRARVRVFRDSVLGEDEGYCEAMGGKLLGELDEGIDVALLGEGKHHNMRRRRRRRRRGRHSQQASLTVSLSLSLCQLQKMKQVQLLHFTKDIYIYVYVYVYVSQ